MTFVYGISAPKAEKIISGLNWPISRINRIKKAVNGKNEFCAMFENDSAKSQCMALCAFEPGKVAYLDEFAAAEHSHGAGFRCLRLSIERIYHKCWLLSSPKLNSDGTYSPDEELNEKYHKCGLFDEAQIENTMWNCPVSLFFTKNVSKSEALKCFHEKFG